jgi:hypothetical protein
VRPCLDSVDLVFLSTSGFDVHPWVWLFLRFPLSDSGLDKSAQGKFHLYYLPGTGMWSRFLKLAEGQFPHLLNG